MRTTATACLLLAFCLAGASPARAALPQADADAVAKLLKNTPTPARSTDDFQKWVHNTLLLTATSCWRIAGGDPLRAGPAVFRRSALGAGSYQLHDDEEVAAVCHELATKGVQPRCDYALFFGDREKRDHRLPTEYVQLQSAASLEAIQGLLTCRLIEKPLAGSRQTFAATRVHAAWSEPPELRPVQLASGARLLRAASIRVEVPGAPDHDGKPFRSAVLAVLPD